MAAGTALLSGALRVMTAIPSCIWGGYHDLTLDGYTYSPLSEPGLATPAAFEIGASEIGIEVRLSGLHSALVPTVLEQDMRGKAVVQHRLIYDQHGTTLLGSVPWFRGAVDSIGIEDTIGGASTIAFRLEGVARGLGRNSGRLTADQDQRTISTTDGSHRYVSSAGELVLYWGGRGPKRAAAALGGGSARSWSGGGRYGVQKS